MHHKSTSLVFMINGMNTITHKDRAWGVAAVSNEELRKTSPKPPSITINTTCQIALWRIETPSYAGASNGQNQAGTRRRSPSPRARRA